MSGHRLWLVDHLLRDWVGHHLGYNNAIARAASDAGVTVVLVGHRECEPSVASEYNVSCAFRTDWRAAPPAWMSKDQRLLRVLEKLSAKRFRADLARWGLAVGPDDLVFAQMIAPRHFDAWLGWFGNLRHPPRLAVHLGYQPQRFDNGFARDALRRLSPAHRERIFLVTDSEKLQEPFTLALSARVSFLPHVVDWKFSDATVVPSDRLSFLVPGNARKEKGFAELWQAVEMLGDLRGSRSIKFRVQCHQPDHFCASIVSGAGRSEGLELVREPLEGAAYFRQFETADVVVIPYHLDHYAMRTSGVFCEARTAGKPVVASRGSWAGDRVAREGGGWLCEEKNAADLADCLRALPEQWPQEARRAAEMQSGARNEFGAASFVQGLFSIAGWGVQK